MYMSKVYQFVYLINLLLCFEVHYLTLAKIQIRSGQNITGKVIMPVCIYQIYLSQKNPRMYEPSDFQCSDLIQFQVYF